MKRIAGSTSGGGSATAHTPVDSADNLRSQAFGRVLDCIGEGELEGPAHPDNPLMDVYVSGTAIQNVDGSYNYHNVKYAYRTGTRSQTPIEGFSAVENTIAVGIEIKASEGPHTVTLTEPNINAVRVSIAFPTLVEQESNGDRNGTAVEMRIDVSTQGGPFVLAFDEIINGKTTSRYERDFYVPLSTNGPWQIRLTRITPDSTSATVSNQSVWSQYTEIINGNLSYPNSALSGLILDSAEFTSIPTRGYDWYLKKIQVPINYNPITREYTGTWDGTFKTVWSDNPAWVYYDILTATRYGCGKYLEDSPPNKWLLYKIAKYCDEMVPTGLNDGTFEPRFTCNVYIQNQDEAYSVIQSFAAIFRAITYMQGSDIIAIQDAPAQVLYEFNNTNVKDGVFVYMGTSKSTRHSVCIVSFSDRQQQGKQVPEYVSDNDAIQRYGYNVEKITAFGCASRGEAHRAGRWLLYSELQDTETCSFSTGLEGLACFPGAIIEVQDKNRAGTRAAGRVVSATLTHLVLDGPFTFTLGSAYTLIMVRSDIDLINFVPTDETPRPETIMMVGLVNPCDVGNPTVTVTEIDCASPLPVLPVQDAVWRIASPILDAQLFKVVSRKEDETIPGQYSIDSIAFNPSKFDFIEDGIQLTTRPITVYPGVPPQPTNVTLTEHAITTASIDVRSVLNIAWDRVGDGITYRVEYRKDSDNWTPIADNGSTSVDIPDVIVHGTYVARVFAISKANLTSAPGYSNPYAVQGKTDVPNGLTSLSAYDGLFEIDLEWSYTNGETDTLTTEIVVSLTNDISHAQLLGSKAYPATKAAELNLPAGVTHYYWGRTINTSGVASLYFPTSPFGGVEGHTINDASKILALESGIIAGTNAGRTLEARLNDLADVATGFSTMVTSVQTSQQSLYSIVQNIESRLSAPYGDIAKAISRIESVTGVSTPTPRTATAPLNPSFGQAWFDISNGGALRFWNGATWVFASGAIVSATAPPNPKTGDLWRDSSTPFMYYRIWDGIAWSNTERATIYSASMPATVGVAVGDTWKDTTDDSFWTYDGTIWIDNSNTGISAIAAQVTALQTTVGSYTTQIQQNINSIGGLSAIYSLKIDNNGHVSGFALSSQLVAGVGVVSDFTVSATRFSVGDDSVSSFKPFIIYGGVVYIDKAMIQNASIDTLQIRGNAVTIPSSVFIPAVINLGTGPTTVATLHVDYGANNPASVAIEFMASVSNGGGGNGATQTFIYRDGLLVYSGQDGIINNVGANRAIALFKDNPGPGAHDYVVQCNYAGNISSAYMLARFLSVTGNLR